MIEAAAVSIVNRLFACREAVNPRQTVVMRRSLGLMFLTSIALAVGCNRPVTSWPPTDSSIECYSLVGRPLRATPPAARLPELERGLADASSSLAANPNDSDRIIWLGRRLGYLWRMREAIDTFTRGAAGFPSDARFLRHRGHRYISVRQFRLATADLRRAIHLMQEIPDSIELDGQPNAANIPLTTTRFNVWYHLGVAHYLLAEFNDAFAAFQQAGRYTYGRDDNVVAVMDWSYMSLRRAGRDAEAARIVASAPSNPRIIENSAYAQRLELYAGRKPADQLLAQSFGGDADGVTIRYGVANWFFCNGRRSEAEGLYKSITACDNWPAFAFIAAEADLARLRDRR